MHTVLINFWSVGRNVGDAYMAPERLPEVLTGEVFGHPRKKNGTRVITSAIVDIPEPGLVRTRSGTLYKLGEPALEYIKYLRDIGYSFDPTNPIKRRG